MIYTWLFVRFIQPRHCEKAVKNRFEDIAIGVDDKPMARFRAPVAQLVEDRAAMWKVVSTNTQDLKITEEEVLRL